MLGDEYGNEGIGRVAQLTSLTENIASVLAGGIPVVVPQRELTPMIKIGT
ncbi:hypothetical protein [Butyricimonas virosa]|nr:hypothetical protein [Butyricimonas virosa]MDY5534496.1 hypothetical protein [Butyricimonas virosa]